MSYYYFRGQHKYKDLRALLIRHGNMYLCNQRTLMRHIIISEGNINEEPRALLINCQILSKLILFILILTVLVTIIEVPLKVKVK